MRIKGASS